jgi:SAM-dependent methyltransferase
VVRWLRGRNSGLQGIYGTDIDAPAITWCQQHLGATQFTTNTGCPPLQFPDDRFDLVYAISVFSHLREDYQRGWLKELARVTRPGGVVLLTVHGPGCCDRLGPDLRRQLESNGFAFYETDSVRALFPAWYRASYQTPEYIRDAASAWFEVRAQIPRGVGESQDIVLLEKPATGRGAVAPSRKAG